MVRRHPPVTSRLFPLPSQPSQPAYTGSDQADPKNETPPSKHGDRGTLRQSAQAGRYVGQVAKPKKKNFSALVSATSSSGHIRPATMVRWSAAAARITKSSIFTALMISKHSLLSENRLTTISPSVPSPGAPRNRSYYLLFHCVTHHYNTYDRQPWGWSGFR